MENFYLNKHMFNNLINFIKAFDIMSPAEFLRLLPDFNVVPTDSGLYMDEVLDLINNNKNLNQARIIDIFISLLTSQPVTAIPLNVLDILHYYSNIIFKIENLSSRIFYIINNLLDSSKTAILAGICS